MTFDICTEKRSFEPTGLSLTTSLWMPITYISHSTQPTCKAFKWEGEEKRSHQHKKKNAKLKANVLKQAKYYRKRFIK